MAYTTINDPQKYFSTKLYSGNGGTQSVTGVGFQPDLVWIKHRTAGHDHNAWDTNRGTEQMLTPNENYVDAGSGSHGANGVTAFGVDGFTLGDVARSNDPEAALVSWNWKANGGTRSTFTESGNNMGGGYQVNATAGISIIDYVGTGSAGYFSHGLGAAPECIMIKNRSYAGNWRFWHHKMSGVTYRASLNTDAAESSGWDSWTVGSSTVTLGVDGSVNRDGDNHIAYCFRSIKGYSKFGIYTGNGNANGVFVYTGFQPRWLVVKPRTLVSNYFQLDTARDTYNPATKFLRLDTTHAEDDGADKDIDFLSNGFKTRAATGFHNDNNQTHLYMAFAESPFVTSNGSPANAV